MANADITKCITIKLDYLFCIIGIKNKYAMINADTTGKYHYKALPQLD
jgi:hypothetical protein